MTTESVEGVTATYSDGGVEDASSATGAQRCGGEAVVGSDRDRSLRVVVESVENGFAVADDGPGIDPADTEHVFERGFTTSRDGTGFGLNIVTRIATAHDWTIRVDEDHDGARFVIETR